MWEFIKFWVECIHKGWESGDGALGVLEGCSLIIAGIIYGRKKFHVQQTNYERIAMYLNWRILLFTFIATTLFVAPFSQYRDLKDKLEKLNNQRDARIIQWDPPKMSGETPKITCLVGGRIESDMIFGTPIFLDARQVRASDGMTIAPNVIVRIIKNRIYLDLDVPTKTKPIQIRAGESGRLPDGWDWNCDSNTLEIVDDQNQAVFQEIFVTNSFVFIRGAVQVGGTVNILNASGFTSPEPHGTFNTVDAGLTTIFEYPTPLYASKRAPH